MYKKIEKVINDWDPMGLFPYAPEDEYSLEINQIVDVLENQPNITTEQLDGKINELFNRMFGVSDFQAEKAHIAERILAE